MSVMRESEIYTYILHLDLDRTLVNAPVRSNRLHLATLPLKKQKILKYPNGRLPNRITNTDLDFILTQLDCKFGGKLRGQCWSPVRDLWYLSNS